VHNEFVTLGKVFAVAMAVGLDVLAISVGVGVARLARGASLKLGFTFAGSEIAMQLIGYELGAGAGRAFGEVAAYIGCALLAAIGLFMIRSSFRLDSEGKFDVTSGSGLVATALSVSLDSLGVGIALPGVSIPLLPLLITVSITTTSFTLIGLAFGARLGERYESRAERAAGIMLIALAALFTAEKLMSGRAQFIW
jgi:manganese efflux pump family protein